MKTAMQSLSRQLAGNPRLQLGLGLIGVLVFVFVLGALHDWRVAQQQNAIEQEVELRQTRSLRGQDAWIQRAAEAGAAREAMFAEIPVVATPGLAQASFQGWLRNAGNSVRSTTSDLNIDVSAPIEMEDHPGIYRVRATISAALSPRQAFEFMNTIESAGNLAIVETVQVRADHAQRVNMTLVGYYRTGAAGGETP